MSGGSTLGTLLVQRLDAVLGTSIASHAHLIAGGRSTAVTAPGAAARIQGPDDATRAPLEPGRAQDIGGAVRASGKTLLHPATTSLIPADAGKIGQTQRPVGRNDTASLPGPSLPSATPSSASTAMLLGPTARLIHALLANAGGQASAIHGHAPITSAENANRPTQTAAALRQAIESSGLFYESHLASLAFGKRDRAALMDEPQAKWPSDARPLAPAPTTHTPSSNAALLNPPDAAAMTRQQLEALATQQVAWTGDAWPGTKMNWHLGRDADQHGQPGADDEENGENAWRSTLNLRLPNLGEVRIDLRLTGERVSLHIESDQAERLSAQAEQLASGLRSHGISPTTLEITATPAQEAPA